MRKHIVEPLLIAVFLLSSVVFSYFSVMKIEQHTRDVVGSSLQTVLNTVNEALFLWGRDRMNDAVLFASTPTLSNLTTQLLKRSSEHTSLLTQSEVEQIRTLLFHQIKRNNYQGFFVISPELINIASMRDANLGKINLIAQQRPTLLARVFNGETLIVPAIRSDVPINENEHQAPTMFAATPIIDTNGVVIAVFTIRIDPINDFSRITGLGRIGQSGESYVFDRKGVLLSTSRFEEYLQLHGVIQPGQRSVLSVKITEPAKKGAAKLTLMAKSAIQGNKGMDTQGYINYRGVEAFGAWLWNTELNLGLATEISAEEALKPYLFARELALITTIALIMSALIIMVYLIYRRIISVQRLKYSKEQLERVVEQRTQQLQDSNTGLMQQVSEREKSEQELLAATQQLTQLNNQLQDLALKDALTGIYNRRAFDEYYACEWSRCLRGKSHLAIIFIDIDYFKNYNDYYGHNEGDHCLRRVAQALRQDSYLRRPSDFVARYGGEEFVIVLNGADESYAKMAATHICLSIETLAIEHCASEVDNLNVVTISAGVASFIPNEDDEQVELLQSADQALYQAKNRGRNQVVVYGQLDSADRNLGGQILPVGKS